MTRRRRPVTTDEWQTAVNAADALLQLESCRMYGLITGGPRVHVARCEQLLREGAAKSIVPQPDAVDRMILDLCAPPEK